MLLNHKYKYNEQGSKDRYGKPMTRAHIFSDTQNGFEKIFEK